MRHSKRSRNLCILFHFKVDIVSKCSLLTKYSRFKLILIDVCYDRRESFVFVNSLESDDKLSRFSYPVEGWIIHFFTLFDFCGVAVELRLGFYCFLALKSLLAFVWWKAKLTQRILKSALGKAIQKQQTNCIKTLHRFRANYIKRYL